MTTATRWATLGLLCALALPASAQDRRAEPAAPQPARVSITEGRDARQGAKPLPTPQQRLRAAAQSARASAWSASAFLGAVPGMFVEDFNTTTNGDIPAGWTRFESGAGSQTNTAKQWRVNTRTVGGAPQQVAFSEFENLPGTPVPGVFAIDWLVTPQLALGSTSTLTFDAAQGFTTVYTSQLDVLVSATSPTDTSSFTLVQGFTEADFPLATAGYGQFTVDLSAYAGQSVYVAFRHTNNDGDDWILGNVVVTLGSGGPSAPPLAEDWESVVAGGSGSTLPAGWIQYEAGAGAPPPDGSAWGIYFAEVVGTDTNNVAGSFFETIASGQPSLDYLVSPLAGINAGDFLIFQGTQIFAAPFGSELLIRVSTTSQTDTSSFTTVATFSEADFAVFPAFSPLSADLSAYAGQDVYIAFVHRQTDGDNLAIDNLRTGVPMTASVGTVAAAVQGEGTVVPSADPILVFAGNVPVDGDAGALTVTSLTFTTAGTTNTADLDEASVLYFGSALDGATAVPFGSPIANPNGTLTFTGSQAVTPGNNFFALVYVADGVTSPPNQLDATFESATVDGTVYAATPTTLAGSVTLISGPDNDNFANARVLTGLSDSDTGTNIGATQEAGEPIASCVFLGLDGENSVWWRYTAPTGGRLSVSLAASDFNTALSFHDASQTELACDDDSGGNLTSAISNFLVTNGQTVYIRVSSFAGDEGMIDLQLTFTPTVGTEDAPAEIGLSAARPNPTAGAAQFVLGVDRAQAVTVEVLDLLGRRVATLLDRELAAGATTLRVDAGLLVPGQYVVRFTGETVSGSQRLTVTR